MSESSESISHVLYVLAFDCPLPPLLSSIPAMCRFAAATLAIPFVFCMLLDLVAYLIARTLHLSPRDIRLSRSPLGSKSRGKSFTLETSDADGIPATAIAYPDEANASLSATAASFGQEPFDGPSQPVTPLDYSPQSTRTSISSSSVSAASSDSSDEGDNLRRAHNIRPSSSINSLGLMNDFDNESPFANQLPQTHRRKPFAYEEDDSSGVSREKTPRAFDITPSINSIDEEGLLVPSSIDSTSTSDTELNGSADEPTLLSIADVSESIPAPRQAVKRDCPHEPAQAKAATPAGMVFLGAPV